MRSQRTLDDERKQPGGGVEPLSARQRDAYLRRLGLSRAPRPTRTALALLQHRHLCAVPFENLDLLLGRPLALEPSELYEKVVTRARGGICYELNLSFGRLLGSLGFHVELLSAGVYVDGERPSPDYDHLALRVNLEEPWLVDVGFGLLSRRPLRWAKPGIQAQGSARFRLSRIAGRIRVESGAGRRFRRRLLIATKARRLSQFAHQVAWHQTSEEAPFRSEPYVSLVTPRGRRTLSGLSVRLRPRGATRTVGDAGALGEVLRGAFGLGLSRPELRELFARAREAEAS